MPTFIIPIRYEVFENHEINARDIFDAIDIAYALEENPKNATVADETLRILPSDVLNANPDLSHINEIEGYIDERNF